MRSLPEEKDNGVDDVRTDAASTASDGRDGTDDCSGADVFSDGSDASDFEDSAKRTSLYATLNLPPHRASEADIRRAYHALSRAFHPDKVGVSADTAAADDATTATTARRAFDRIRTAHDVLADPLLRFAYDQGGIAAVAALRRLRGLQSRRRGGGRGDHEDNCAAKDSGVEAARERKRRRRRRDKGGDNDGDESASSATLYDRLRRELLVDGDATEARRTLRRIVSEHRRVLAAARRLSEEELDVSMDLPQRWWEDGPRGGSGPDRFLDPGRLLAAVPIDTADATSAQLQVAVAGPLPPLVIPRGPSSRRRHWRTPPCRLSVSSACRVGGGSGSNQAAADWQALLSLDVPAAGPDGATQLGATLGFRRDPLSLNCRRDLGLRTARTLHSGTLLALALHTSSSSSGSGVINRRKIAGGVATAEATAMAAAPGGNGSEAPPAATGPSVEAGPQQQQQQQQQQQRYTVISITSVRTLLLPECFRWRRVLDEDGEEDEDDEPLRHRQHHDKLQASWKVALAPVSVPLPVAAAGGSNARAVPQLLWPLLALRARLAQVALSLQTLVFPQWRAQLVTGSGADVLLRLKYSAHPQHGLRVSCTDAGLGWLLGGAGGSSHWKVTWLTRPFDLAALGAEWRKQYLGFFTSYASKSANSHSTASPPPVPQWQLQYGLKCATFVGDSATAATVRSGNDSGAPFLWTRRQWAVVCQLQGSVWNLKVPIVCGASSDAPVLIIASLLVGQILDQVLVEAESWWKPWVEEARKPAQLSRHARKELLPLSLSSVEQSPPFRDLIRATACRKREYEASINGLIVVNATVEAPTTRKMAHHGTTTLILADILQFWVNESRLELDLDRQARAAADFTATEITELPWWMQMMALLRRLYGSKANDRPSLSHQTTKNSTLIKIRYQYRGFVYEVNCRSSEIALPAPSATLLGPVEQVC